VKREPAKAACVHKTQFAARTQLQNGVGVRRNRHFCGRYQQASGHSEMHDPLQCRCARRPASRGQIEDNMLADAMDPIDSRAGEGFGHNLRIGFEGLFITAEPDGIDALAAYAFVHAIRDGFDFRELGHRLLFSQNVAQLLRADGDRKPG